MQNTKNGFFGKRRCADHTGQKSDHKARNRTNQSNEHRIAHAGEKIFPVLCDDPDHTFNVALRAGDEDLCEAVNYILELLSDNGTLDDLYWQYLE